MHYFYSRCTHSIDTHIVSTLRDEGGSNEKWRRIKIEEKNGAQKSKGKLTIELIIFT